MSNSPVITRVPRCACAINRDGSATRFLCSLHAEQDPCYTMSLVTGNRRKGTIKRGTCTNCGWHGPQPTTTATEA